MRTPVFSPHDKLIQTLLAILAGCKNMVEVNSQLKHEDELANVWQWTRLADQSTLSRTLDALTRKQIEQLRVAPFGAWTPSPEPIKCSVEIEQFRNDKQGLHLVAKRKQRFLAQKGFILLTDLAHNLLADFRRRALGRGLYRLFAIADQ